MPAPLTYLEFVAAFVAGPVALLLATGSGIDSQRRRAAVAGVAIMLVLALSYTTPWDNYLIARGVWWYGEGTVAARIWNAPLEEYLFIALQTLLAALWLYRRPLPLAGPGRTADPAGAEPAPEPAGPEATAGPAGPDDAGHATPDADRATPDDAGHATPDADRAVPDGGLGTADAGHAGATDAHVTPDPVVGALGAGAWLGVAALGALGLWGDTFYLGAILAWAAPVLALQWAVGGSYLVAVRRRLLWAVVPPVLYLSFVDRLAIGWGLWTISPEHSTGLTVLGLPVEEGAFFLVTTLLVVQGLVLFHWVLETRPYRGVLGR